MTRRLIHASMVVIVSLGVLANGPRSFADELPRLELGIGATGISVPDYRGSSEQRSYVLPFPYVVYRGRRFAPIATVFAACSSRAVGWSSMPASAATYRWTAKTIHSARTCRTSIRPLKSARR